MVFRNTFNHGLIRAELETDGEPFLRLYVKQYVLDKISDETYDSIRRDNQDFGAFKIKNGKEVWLDEEERTAISTKTDVDETIKVAVEWAKQKLKGKKFKVHIYRN